MARCGCTASGTSHDAVGTGAAIVLQSATDSKRTIARKDFMNLKKAVVGEECQSVCDDAGRTHVPVAKSVSFSAFRSGRNAHAISLQGREGKWQRSRAS